MGIYAAPVTSCLYNRLVNLGYRGWVLGRPTAAGGGADGRALIRPDRKQHFAALGFAWRPLTNGSLVVRGGYGLTTTPSVYNLMPATWRSSRHSRKRLSVASSAANPLSIQSGFLAAANQTLTNTYAIDPNLPIGYAQSWNLTIQHDLPFSFFGTARLTGDQRHAPRSAVSYPTRWRRRGGIHAAAQLHLRNFGRRTPSITRRNSN